MVGKCCDDYWKALRHTADPFLFLDYYSALTSIFSRHQKSIFIFPFPCSFLDLRGGGRRLNPALRHQPSA
jgi:hypothetical protein